MFVCLADCCNGNTFELDLSTLVNQNTVQMARECGTCEGLFIGSNSRDLLCCVQCNEQRCVACELQLAKKWHKSTKSIISGNKTWVCTNCVDRHEHRANSANKGKQRTVAAAEAKKGKKQQQGASATAAVHGDSIAAASVSKVVVADVCPSCKQSTESSQCSARWHTSM
jgi:hypothetical protein